jgi:predicted chitinase
VAKSKAQDINLSGTNLEAVLKKAALQAGLSGSELAAFMSQASHETMGFFSLVEMGTPQYFRRYDPVHAPVRARNLGNTRAGDGERYRGRGYIQLTGRYNYRQAGEALGLPLEAHPELAAQPHIAATIAVWYWEWRVRPRVTNFADVREVTRPINPGLNGLADRRIKFQTYQVALL